MDGGVPDTFSGRLEMLVLHLYLVAARLSAAGKVGRALSQNIFDAFTDDMDAALREAAVGDQAVPKRIARMTRIFYGRAKAYDHAFGQSPADIQAALADVIARNLYPDVPSLDEAQHRSCTFLTSYMLGEWQRLAELEDDDLMQGAVAFPSRAHLLENAA